MRLTFATTALLSVAMQHCAFAGMMRNTKTRTLKKLPDGKCLVFINIFDCEAGVECESELECELPDGTFLDVEVDKSWKNENILNGNLSSAETMLVSTDAEIVGDVLLVPTTPELIHKPALAVTGTRTVLAVKVIAPDDEYRFSLEQLSEDVFGNGVDPVNLVSQYFDCSLGQLNFTKAEDSECIDCEAPNSDISNGVVQVYVTTNTTEGSKEMQKEVKKQLELNFGTKPQYLADHVMFCLPPNTLKHPAVATVNGWKSMYNNVVCNRISPQMHEIGHNLNLQHSGEGDKKYGDQSGYIGYGYRYDDGPKMCFNAGKSWQLGWYTPKTYTFELTYGHWRGDLIGAVDYDSAVNEKVVIKINNPDSPTDYYLNFNRKTGFNSQTKEGGDQVELVEQGGEGITASQSYLLAKMIGGESYVISAIDVEVIVNSIDKTASPYTANLCISYNNEKCGNVAESALIS